MFNFSFIILFFFTSSCFANTSISKKNLSFYQQIFPNASAFISLKINDPISSNPINTEVKKIISQDKIVLGYVREVVTSTGCNGECLPVVFTLFYNKDKYLLRLKSLKGLTKIFHAPFTADDYEQLNLLLAINPESYLNVSHPRDMVDALTGATKKEYKKDVVKSAAFSCLRINSYNQHTLKFLSKIK